MANHSSGVDGEEGHHAGQHGISLAAWRWSEFSSHIIISLTILLCGLFKLVFHRINILSKSVPESCVLILLGVVVGATVDLALNDQSLVPHFTASLFFNILLPPIILNSAFALYDRDFLSNLSSVLMFAVVGTLINVLVIGLVLYSLATAGILGKHCELMGIIDAFIFSSLISAVDPVAVLAIFEEIHVNNCLYFLVFGESLLNDGVTVVLYNTMKSLSVIQVTTDQIVLAVASFFFVTIGGCTVGIFVGLLTSFITKYTKDVRVFEPILIFSTSYLAFLGAEIFHWSGIISIIGYGLTVKRYAFSNISAKSYTTVKYATQTMAVTSDCVIFLFLGLVTFTEKQRTEPEFIVATILICLLTRFGVTYLLSWLVNCRRANKINFREQFVMAYGGLRGAVGFSLALVLDDTYPFKELFLTTALSMVFFTVFVQGSTIKLIVKYLHISLKQEKDKSIGLELQSELIDDLMVGIQAITGRVGTVWLVEWFKTYEQKYLKRFLVVDDSTSKLYRKLTKNALHIHYTNLYAPNIIAQKNSDTLDGRANVEVQLRPKTFSNREDLKALRSGIRQSSWKKYNNKFDTTKQADTRTLHEELERSRIRQTFCLQSQVLDFNPDAESHDSPVLRRGVRPDTLFNEYRKTQDLKRERYHSMHAMRRNPLPPLRDESLHEESGLL